MPKGLWWVVGAAALAYIVLRPSRQTGTVSKGSSSPLGSGPAQRVGELLDGAIRLFGSSRAEPSASAEFRELGV